MSAAERIRTAGGDASVRLLLHTCCGPCSTAPLQWLRRRGVEVTGFAYNPNIEPAAERLRRLETLRAYARQVGLLLLEADECPALRYHPAVRAAAAAGEVRCAACYRLRLNRTAQAARRRGFEWFTTTLLVSPYQRQDLIRAAGEAAGRRWGIPFQYHDLRPLWPDVGRLAREAGLYRQKYCGCSFSLAERERKRERKRER